MTVAASFIRQACQDQSDIKWLFAVSRQIMDELSEFHADLPKDVAVFNTSPARSREARRQLLRIEAYFQPDVIFTLFGPAYAKFHTPHLLGCANAWLTNPTWAAYRTIKHFPFGAVTSYVQGLYRLQLLKLADSWITQTETARQGLHHRLRVPLDQINIVANTCDQIFIDHMRVQVFPEKGTKIRILCFAASYLHKNLISIPHVAAHLESMAPSLDFEFVITLPPKEKLYHKMIQLAKSLGVGKRLVNAGPIPLANGPELYQSCHISFLPTLLETFSATYPESMAMGVPIVTTDFGFSRDACQDAALYYPYQDHHAAANCIKRLLDDRDLWETQIARGKAVLTRLPDSETRYQQYRACIRKMVDRRNA